MLEGIDIVVLLALTSRRVRNAPDDDLGRSLRLKESELAGIWQRAQRSHLWNPITQTVMNSNLLEFLVHGVRYMFPAEVSGVRATGVPTAHSAAPLSSLLAADRGSGFVWAFSAGKATGSVVAPLDSRVPELALADPVLHQLLALVDAMRLGRAREKHMAGELLVERLAA